MNKVLTILLSFIFAITHAQTDLISQNGDFEVGTGYPTNHNQLEGFCDHWFGSGNSTPDWFTTQTLPGALRGPCQFESASDFSTIFNAQPKMTTPNGSLFYAGFGSTEFARNVFSRPTYANSMVKVSFWYAARGSSRDTRIAMRLVDDDNQGNNIEIAWIDLKPFSIPNSITPCTWYYYESPWLATGAPEFERIQIGGTSPPNPAGDFFSAGYIYIDDVKVLNGYDCCQYTMLYENTVNLPQLTHVDYEIRAGYDAGIANNAGDVHVLTGQNVTFKAGSSIQLNPGFYTDIGSIYTGIIEECNPQSAPSGQTVDILVAPNIFTPDGDNYNDVLCFTVNNAQSYDVQVYSRWGYSDQQLLYSSSGSVYGNTVCTWNGVGYSDGTYYYVANFYNCTNTASVAQFVYRQGNGHKPEFIQDLDPPIQAQSVIVYPNPNDGIFKLQLLSQGNTIIDLTDIFGNSVKRLNSHNNNLIDIDITQFPKGVYILRITDENGSTENIKIINK